MKASSELVRATAAIFALLVLIILLGSIAAAPFMKLSAIENTIATNQETLSKLRHEIAREGELRKENGDLAALGQEKDLLLKGDTIGIAGANMQKLMNSLVVRYGAQASSFQILPPEADQNLMRIPMSLSISVGIDGLRDILYALEAGTPLIFIDELTIRSKQDDFHTPDRNYIGPFDVTLQLSGFSLKSGAP